MVHHTAPHIPFKTAEEWKAAQAQLSGTVHCNYPRWYACIFHMQSYILQLPGIYAEVVHTLELSIIWLNDSHNYFSNNENFQS